MYSFLYSLPSELFSLHINATFAILAPFCIVVSDYPFVLIFSMLWLLLDCTWRIAMRRVWRVLWRTHNNMLPHLAGMIDPELWFAKRCNQIYKYVYEI